MTIIRKVGRRTIGTVATMAAVAGFVAVTAASTGAAGPIPVECDTAGTVDVSVDSEGVAHWDVSLEGLCSGQLNGIKIATVEGGGTSAGSGLCDESLVATDLDLDVVVTERDVVTGQIVSTPQTWTFPVSTYVVANEFVIGGGAQGLGVLSTRIFARCGEEGSPNTRAIFSFRS